MLWSLQIHLNLKKTIKYIGHFTGGFEVDDNEKWFKSSEWKMKENRIQEFKRIYRIIVFTKLIKTLKFSSKKFSGIDNLIKR